ncbi:E1 ubiquitin-activating protein [Hypoxylon texense]
MSGNTIRYVFSEHDLILAEQGLIHAPQVMPSRDPGLASSPSTYIGLHAMGVESPKSSIHQDDEEALLPAQEPKEPKMKRLWNAVKRAVRREKHSAHHPFPDAVAGGPGNRILVTKEFSVTSEQVSAEDAAAGPVVPTVTATATGPLTSPRKFEDGAATTIAKTPTTATTASATKMDNGKHQQHQRKKEYKFEDDVDEEDELQDVETARFPKSFSRNFRRSLSAALPQVHWR